VSAILENNLDFEILDTDNTKIIVFIDASTYVDTNPEKPLLEVVLPGFNQYFLVNIAHSQVTIMNANTIGITNTFSNDYNCLSDLPDGVWEFTYRICPYDKVYIKKYVLRAAQLNKKLNLVYKQLENSDCSLKEDRKLKNKLTDINIFIETAKAYAEDCNQEKASNFYQIADKFTNDLINILK
jgi:hypothetical protein